MMQHAVLQLSSEHIHVFMCSNESQSRLRNCYNIIILRYIVNYLICSRQNYSFQGKGLQKTYWLDGREGLSQPLLSSQVDESGNEHQIDGHSFICQSSTDD